jgi:hypothetical protein
MDAVYTHLLKQPRIRFLIADDPGAGKTIMGGLTIKELKFRGMIERTLIVTPANLTPQWQRELHEKFRGIASGSSLRRKGILSERSPHAPERMAIHGSQSAGSPAGRPPNGLATLVDTSCGEAEAPLEDGQSGAVKSSPQ